MKFRYDLIPNIRHLDKKNFFLIAGPCVVEDEKTPIRIAEEVARLADALGIPYIFKASFKKANRSKRDSFTGIGDEKALSLIKHIGAVLKVPTTTDVHSAQDVIMASEFVDVLQIPAFLSRQTDILVQAGKSGKTVNIKKGQFLGPESMKYAVEKVNEEGNYNVLLTERGTTFGYHDLVVDFRNIPLMQQYAPVVVDCTHSLQQPNQADGVTGGQPEMIETIARAAVAVQADGLFMEVHPDPSLAKSDGDNMLKLDKLEPMLIRLLKIRQALFA